MIVYHGTTKRRAQRICAEGFVPRKPSKRVWFAENRGYARGRAKAQARRAHDKPVVLVCDINFNQMKAKIGAKLIWRRNNVIAINASVPVNVLRSYPATPDQPTSPDELACWVNELLRLKPYKGVSRRHPGIDRLSGWVASRYATQPHSTIRQTELVEMARRWLPEYFEGYEIDAKRLHAYRTMKTIEVDLHSDAEPSATVAHECEEEALDCLLSPNPKQRIRGLSIFAEIEEPDLFDWCVMYLNDESINVCVAALNTMLSCKEADTNAIIPFVESENKRIRSAAIAALAVHSGKDAPRWVEYGLKDPSGCVRVKAVALLSLLDPKEHHDVFELALYDPNPEIARRAHKLTTGKGYHDVWNIS